MIKFDSIIEQVKGLFLKSLAEGQVLASSLGVDIGSDSIKVVCFEQSKDGSKVMGFSIEKIIEKNYQEALSKALSKIKRSDSQLAVIGVSGQGVVSRYIDLPMMSKQELDSSMKFEIEKYVPFPLAEVCADYSVVCEMKDKAKVSVLIAAAKNDLVQKRCALANAINLHIKAIDLDCLALANFFLTVASSREKSSGVALINIGKTVSNINVIVDSVPYLSRDIFIGSEDITKRITESLEIEHADAEKLKCDPKEKEEELSRIWEPILHDLAAEIRVSLDYFEARNNKAIEKILLTGGGSRLAGIQDYLHHALSIDVNKWDYAGSLSFGDLVNQNEFKQNSDLLAIALGLSLR